MALCIYVIALHVLGEAYLHYCVVLRKLTQVAVHSRFAYCRLFFLNFGVDIFYGWMSMYPIQRAQHDLSLHSISLDFTWHIQTNPFLENNIYLP